MHCILLRSSPDCAPDTTGAEEAAALLPAVPQPSPLDTEVKLEQLDGYTDRGLRPYLQVRAPATSCSARVAASVHAALKAAALTYLDVPSSCLLLTCMRLHCASWLDVFMARENLPGLMICGACRRPGYSWSCCFLWPGPRSCSLPLAS